jgi:hypothetical protein
VYKKLFGSLILLAVINLFNACNDSPTDIGSELLSQDEIEVLKLDSVTDSLYQESKTFKKVYSLSTASEIYLGKAENLTSHLLLKFVFALPDSIKEDIKNNRLSVLSSWVELVKVYSFGDSSAAFEYDAFKINEFWSSTSFTSDSLQFLDVDNIDLSSNPQVKNDSLYSFNLDNTLVSSWLLNNADSSRATNYGILVSPTLNTNKILGFTAYNITATNDPRLKVVINKPGVFTDTITGFISSDLSAIVGDLASVGSENISVQSGLSAHSKLFFDLSNISTNTVINSAKLTLYSDTVLTKMGKPYTNVLRVYLFSDSTANEVNINYASSLSKIGNTYSGDVTSIIRAIINGIDNQGLLIKSLNDLSGVDLYVFKGSNATDYTKRPKLEILYSRKK